MKKDKYEHINDTALLENFYKDGNTEWLGILLQRYTLLLLGTCMKYLKNEDDAKDSVQQICLKAITELKKYKVEYIKSWLYMIARNHCLMQLRDKNIIISTDEKNNLIAEEDKIAALKEKDITLNKLELAIAALNKEQKTCVTLFYLQKKSYQEISSITGYTLLQIKSNIQNGKRNLRLILERN